MKLRQDIVMLKVNKLIPYNKNNKKHPVHQIELLAKNIEEFGFNVPVLVDLKDNIVAGHGRVLAAKKLGIDEIPGLIVDDLTEAQIKALRIADNRLTEMAETDWEALESEFKELTELNYDVDLTGYKIDDFPLTTDGGGKTDDDAVPEEVEAVSEMGGVWILGNHRLMCGDSTKTEDLAILMQDEKADMVFTDPPYGMNAVKNSGVLNKKYKDIIGDENTDVVKNSFGLWNARKEIWWGANYYSDILSVQSCWIVWDKNNGKSDQMDCELAWTNFTGVTRQFTQASEKKNRVHPTQKPVDLIEWVFNKWGKNVVIVSDPFGGSGSTMIACEKTNRHCRMMELDPHYCDVIIKRWEDYTGKKAEKI